MSVLGIMPVFLRQPADLELVATAIRTYRETCDAELLVIDDGSPAAGLIDEMALASSELEFDVYRKDVNSGFSSTVNVGIKRAAAEGKDALLVNADIDFFEAGWLERMLRQKTSDGSREAEVVGALLLYPSGLIQHGGVFFSRLHRVFSHRFQFGPGDLPEAQVNYVCPVTGALQLIRHATLQEVGVYDESFRMGFEDVDYCLRVFQAGGECVYAPSVRAFHHESVFRGRPSPKIADWQALSFLRLYAKWPQGEMLKYATPVV